MSFFFNCGKIQQPNSQLIGKDPDAGKDGEQKEKRWQRMRWLDGVTDSVDMNLDTVQERVRDGRRALWSQRVGCDLVTEQQQNTITLKFLLIILSAQLSGIKYIVQQPSITPSISKTFSCCKTETLNPANSNSILLLHNPQQQPFYFLSL